MLIFPPWLSKGLTHLINSFMHVRVSQHRYSIPHTTGYGYRYIFASVVRAWTAPIFCFSSKSIFLLSTCYNWCAVHPTDITYYHYENKKKTFFYSRTDTTCFSDCRRKLLLSKRFALDYFYCIVKKWYYETKL